MAAIERKKTVFRISPFLKQYLVDTNREISVPLHYTDLFHYTSAITLNDSQGEDTYWETVIYAQADEKVIYENLKRVYAYLKADGDTSVIEHLYIDRVDMCLHGNTKPFRIRVVNKINDLFDYFYVKEADASRVYGLELEHLLSPNKINYFVTEQTLIEEHIPGIPGDRFMESHLKSGGVNEIRLAKEFVKFNERCLVHLLGDMRADNYVIEVIPDFDEVYFRMRAIDFDQQCFDGRRSIYLPQFFKDNNPIIELGLRHMTPQLEVQYQKEERSRIATRLKAAKDQVNALLNAMSQDEIAPQENVLNLRKELSEFYLDERFLLCKSMGEILRLSLDMVFHQPVRKKYAKSMAPFTSK